jgi:hypothetical protein
VHRRRQEARTQATAAQPREPFEMARRDDRA